jgi:hypothetical protein
MSTYNELRPAAELRSLGWFLRRAAIGIVALTIFVTGGAWLLHASIEPETAEPVTIQTSPNELAKSF